MPDSDEPMQTGKIYEVPCVRGVLLNKKNPKWWPALGPAHSDREHIGFSTRHLHIDNRFLKDAEILEIRTFDTGLLGPPLDPALMVLTDAAPENWDPEDSRNFTITPAIRSYRKGRIVFRGLPIASLPSREYPAETYLRTMRRKMRRESGNLDGDPGWLPILRKAFLQSRLLPGKVCPHRGADLSGIGPDEDGIITCPLHRLRWHADTGQSAG